MGSFQTITIHGTSGSTTSSTIGSSTTVGAELIRSTLARLGDQAEQPRDAGGVDGPPHATDRGKGDAPILRVPPAGPRSIERRHPEVVGDETAHAALPRSPFGRQPQLLDD